MSHLDLDARGVVEMLFHAGHDFAQGEEQQDDITVVVAKFE